MSLTALIASASLSFLSPNSESPVQYQNPPIYAQISQEELSARIMETDDIAKKKLVSAIPFYRSIIMDKGSDRDMAIGRLINIFDRLADISAYEDNKWFFENAVSFYDDTIKNHQGSSHIGRVYLKSGRKIFEHICYMPEKLIDAVERFEMAYKKGSEKRDKMLMAQARFEQAYAMYYAATGLALNDEINSTLLIEALKGRYTRKKIIKYFGEVENLVPGTDLAQRAENFLRLIKSNE